MIRYSSSNVKLINSELDKVKSGIKNGFEVTLNLSSNVIGVSNDETNFRHKQLLTDAQVSRFCKTFTNNSSANVTLSKTQLSKMVQSGEFFTPSGPLTIFGSLPPVKIINSIVSSYEKELKKMDSKKLEDKGIDNLLVDKGLNIIGKKNSQKLWLQTQR